MEPLPPPRRAMMLAIDPHHPLHVVHQGYSVLVAQPDGSIDGAEGREGLFDFEARILSRHRFTLGGRQPEYHGGGTPEPERWRDRLKEWFLEHAPGRTAAALRFALGELEA